MYTDVYDGQWLMCSPINMPLVFSQHITIISYWKTNGSSKKNKYIPSINIRFQKPIEMNTPSSIYILNIIYKP